VKTKALGAVLATLFLLMGAQVAMAVEEASYAVLKREGRFEVREYAPHVVAETLVEGGFEDAGSRAFQRLFRYISGDNLSQTKVAMTAPVSQTPAGEKISMTAPVGQRRVENRWAVSFMMPQSYTLGSLPKPNDPAVVLRQVPAQKMAVVRYSGTWSEKNYARHKQELESWMHEAGMTSSGPEMWARFNAPFTPWFLRRNEIQVPVE
jgi:hypothetical protein